MKLIQQVPIWSNGLLLQATVLSASASNVNLGKSATFTYILFNQDSNGYISNQLAFGTLVMQGLDYEAWQEDTAAWEFIASKLNLTITGDYVAPVPVVEETIVNEEISE
jgi:hypothetical protein